MTNKIEPLRITIEFYNKKISTEVDHSDLTLEDLHGMWIEIVRAMGYSDSTVKKQYEE